MPETLRTLAESDALVLHDPMSGWLRSQIAGVTERMHSGAAGMREAIEYAQHNLADDVQSKHLQGVLCDVLDAKVAVGIDVETLVPADVWTWYGDHSTYRID